MAKKKINILGTATNFSNNIEQEEQKLDKALAADLEKKKKEQHIDAFLKVDEITINPEFQTLIRFHTEEEFSQFKENLISDGKVREPIIVTNLGNGYTLVDGHHRLKASKELAKDYPSFTEIPTIILSFDNKEAVLIWMLRNQLGRRNLTPAERFDIASQLETLGYFAKMAKSNQGKRNDLTSVSKDTEVKKQSQRTANQIAKTANISPISAIRFKKLKNDAPEIYQEVLEGNRALTNAYNEVLATEKLERKDENTTTNRITKTAIFNALQNKKLIIETIKQTNVEITTSTLKYVQTKQNNLIIQGIKPHYKESEFHIIGYLLSPEYSTIIEYSKYCNFLFAIAINQKQLNEYQNSLNPEIGILLIDEKQRIIIDRKPNFLTITPDDKLSITIEMIGISFQ